jgi:hypothetical protein
MATVLRILDMHGVGFSPFVKCLEVLSKRGLGIAQAYVTVKQFCTSINEIMLRASQVLLLRGSLLDL